MAAAIPTGKDVLSKMKTTHSLLGDAIEKAEDDGKIDLGELAMLVMTHAPRIAREFGVEIPSLGN